MRHIGLSLLFFACVAISSLASAADSPGTVLITGSSRGIGFAFATKYAETGWSVIATARDPDKSDQLKALAKAHKNVRLEKLDVTDLKSVDALAAKLKGTPIDLLLNNAGIDPTPDKQIFGNIDYALFDEIMRTNVLGPIKVTEAFTPHVAASKQKKMITISSGDGSLSGVEKRPGKGAIFYRASKSALNMALVNVAKDVADKGITVVMLTPGVVATDMAAAAGPLPQAITPEKSVGLLMPLIEKYTMENTGKFYRNTGDAVSW